MHAVSSVWTDLVVRSDRFGAQGLCGGFGGH